MAHSPIRLSAAPPPIRLELSGPRLADGLARLAVSCEASGGVEQYVRALELKSDLFRSVLGEDGAAAAGLEPETLRILLPFMPTVRRRIAPWMERPAFDGLKADIGRLLDALRDNSRVDEGLAAFGDGFCAAERPRWVRDLGAELLHQLAPERFPMMTRWVWDRAANTGVLREIWFGGEDGALIDVPDSCAAFLTLREELSGFLTSKGVFRDVIGYVDLLCAQIYAQYICAQGGSYLRVDFSAEEDPAQYTRRLLGLDAVGSGIHLSHCDGALGDNAARRSEPARTPD